jgi:hypothetical protein
MQRARHYSQGQTVVRDMGYEAKKRRITPSAAQCSASESTRCIPWAITAYKACMEHGCTFSVHPAPLIEEHGENGTATTSHSTSVGMQYRIPNIAQWQRCTWTRNEEIAAKQFDARARSLPPKTIILQLMHRRVHRATIPPDELKRSLSQKAMENLRNTEWNRNPYRWVRRIRKEEGPKSRYSSSTE